MLAPLAKGQRGLCHGSSSINFFLVSSIETAFLSQSGPNLHEVFIGTSSRMSLIVSKIRPSNSRVIGPERLKLAVFNLVSAIETIFLYQSGPKLHKVFISTRSRMSSIMSKIPPLVSAIETTFLNQSGPNLHEVFIGTSSRMSSIVSKICPVTPELLALKD